MRYFSDSPLREFWGRGGGEPNAGKKSGKNAALDRSAPVGSFEKVRRGFQKVRAPEQESQSP